MAVVRLSPFERFLVRRSFNAKEREKLYRKLIQLLGNGVSLERALSQIQLIQKKRGSSLLAKTINEWRRNLENGQNFGACLAPYIPVGEAMLIETGADSGKLERSIQNAADMVAQQKRIRTAIVSNASYPVLLICVLIAALIMTSYRVIPAFTEVLPVEEWEGVAALVASVSMMIKEIGHLILFGFMAFVFVIAYSMPRWEGRLRVTFDQIPPWSLYRVWQGSSFLLSMASLMSAGVKIDENAVNKLASRVSPYLRTRLRAFSSQISAGLNFGDALEATGYRFPDDNIIDDLKIYATLRGFEANLSTITNDWIEEAEESVTASMKILNTVALFLIAITMGALISALFGVIQQIQATTNNV